MIIANANATNLPFASGIAQTCVTSPPYYGLRSYLPDCHPDKEKEIGLEQTPAEYVAQIVAVMREVWRVLRDDGTLWLNLGDSYSTGAMNPQPNIGARENRDESRTGAPHRKVPEGYKQKDLLGIPWRVAFALRDDGAASPETMRAIERVKYSLLSDYDCWEAVPDKTRVTIEALEREFDDANKGGWYLRSDIIWHKPNPMPESVTDRPTKAHEYVFLLSKQARYFYDAEAVKENAETANPNSISFRENGKSDSRQKHKDAQGVTPNFQDESGFWKSQDGKRNARTVWTIATRPYSGAHFATMPPALAEKCILAGSSDRACPTCGKCWERVVETNGSNYAERKAGGSTGGDMETGHRKTHAPGVSHDLGGVSKTIGHRPACACYGVPLDMPPAEYIGLPTVPSIVLDPFTGSGTTARVAAQHRRNFIGTELNPAYIALTPDRVTVQTQF